MGRKRKVEASRLDEVDRTMYSSFCSAASSLSQLYTQAMNHQKISFQAGERNALEKLYQWILRHHEEGSRVTVSDIVSHIQNEMDYGGDDVAMSPRLQHQHQYPQATPHIPSSGLQQPSMFGQASNGLAPRPAHCDQTKNSVFSNALSSPIRRSLQPYHLAQEGGARNQDVSSESNPPGSNDSSMDMHSDSPTHGPY